MGVGVGAGAGEATYSPSIVSVWFCVTVTLRSAGFVQPSTDLKETVHTPSGAEAVAPDSYQVVPPSTLHRPPSARAPAGVIVALTKPAPYS